MTTDYAFVLLLPLAILNPIGQFCIKIGHEREAHVLWWMGTFIAMLLYPCVHLAAVYYAENVFIAPVHSTSILWSIMLAFFFLDEGKFLGWQTVEGFVSFVSGLCLALFVILHHDEARDDSFVNWDMLTLYLAVWFAIVTTLVGFASFTGHGTWFLFSWVAAAGALLSVNILMSVDLWLFKRDHAFITTGLGFTTAVLFAGASLANILILNFVLQQDNFDYHVIGPLYQGINLFMDMGSDLLVFERYKKWEGYEFVIVGIGFYMIFQGIFLLNSHRHPKNEMDYIKKISLLAR